MGKIFCIMGKSSSGKDTIFKILKKDEKLSLKAVISYTTRPKRYDETDGVEYYFIDKEILKKYKLKNKIIELRKYNTIQGIWYYCTIDDGQIDLQKNNYIIISTLQSFTSLNKFFGSSNVIPIYIEVEDGLRLERALIREKSQDKPDYVEMCRRFIADSEDFSEENLKDCGIIKRYSNVNLEDCISSIKKSIYFYL